jgi:hypothetical protein
MFTGTKYQETKQLPTKTVAAMLRKELKATFPEVTFTVRSGSTGMHGTLDVRVVAVPFPVLANTAPSVFPWYSRHTAEAQALLKRVEEMANAYNFDNSRTEEDYFHVRFYLSVEISRELEQAEREEATAQASLAPLAPLVELLPVPAPAPEVEAQVRWMAFLGLE